MRKAGAVLLAFLAFAVAFPAAQRSGPDIGLVLLIAIDQFRYDYLTRFRPEYTSGIARLLREGAVFTDAHLEHYPTVTAIGHATMLTGATPSESGIIGNDWFDRETGKTVTSVSDPAVELVGADGPASSPHRLLVTTVGDQLKMASSAPRGAPEAPKVLGISLKDRSSILPAGRGANAAYWWDSKIGGFVTSTYYMREVPQWVQAFNAARTADKRAGMAWSPLSAPATVFRPMPSEPGTSLYDAITTSPFGNDMLLEFVEQALVHERLGARNATDVLSVSFSSNDLVGHSFGPDSPEVRDISVRTDRVIGRLLDRLDEAVGLERTLVALTADHGVAPMPEWLSERGLPGGRMTTKELFDPVQRALTAEFGEGRWLLATAGSSPYLNYELMESLRLDPAAVRAVAARAAATVPHVARVYTRDQLIRGDVPADRIGTRVLRGFNAQRSGDLEIILEPNWIRAGRGTTHGTPYNYDTHIPLILMGQRIRPGSYSDRAALNDLAPTLATLLGVETPSGSVGRVLTEAMQPVAEGSRSRR